MKRICILIPELTMASAIVQELEEAGINENNIHVVGNPLDLQRAHIPEANLAHTSDLIPALKRGLKIGFFLAAATLILFTLVVPANWHIPVWAVALMIFFGIVFGAWASTLIGVGIQDPTVEKYEKYLKQGHYLMLVDSPDEREAELADRILNHHKGAQLVSKTIH